MDYKYGDLFRVANRLQDQNDYVQKINTKLSQDILGLSFMYQMANWIVLNPEWIEDNWLDDL